MPPSPEWSEEALRRLIDDAIEEGSRLEYKGPDALGKSAPKKRDIAKDVSSMANSSGGILIYGITEGSEHGRRHLPESIQPADRTEFSREWLDQVLTSNIRPPIQGLTIHPVPIGNSTTQVVYVVEIPESSTAHQVTADGDLRYYRRFNFHAEPMEDYEIRLVMNRGNKADADVEINSRLFASDSHEHTYVLLILVHSRCDRVINHLKLDLRMPPLVFKKAPRDRSLPNVDSYNLPDGTYHMVYRSTAPLFPHEDFDIGEIVFIRFQVDDQIREAIREQERRGQPPAVEWRLYADDMPAKAGTIPMSQLHQF